MGASMKSGGTDDLLNKAVRGELQPTSASPPASGMNPTPPMAQMQAPMNNSPAGKGSPSGKGGSSYTFSNQSAQPQMGVPNKYSNTVQPGDNMNAPAVLGASRGKGM